MNWGAIGSFLAGLFATLWPYIEKGLYAVAGVVWQRKCEEAKNARNLAESLKLVVEEERRAKARPTSGAAQRLRDSGYTKR